jgi:hypothetical protein
VESDDGKWNRDHENFSHFVTSVQLRGSVHKGIYHLGDLIFADQGRREGEKGGTY